MNLEGYKSGLDRGRPMWVEVCWVVIRSAIFLAPIPLPSAVRCAVLRFFGARIGRGCVIRHGVQIAMPWRLVCGDFVWFGEGVQILNLAQVRIGSHVCISQEAFLCTGSHDFDDAGFRLRVAPIAIADSCWLAARAFVGPGVSIGEGSMVTAGAIVGRDVPENSIAKGNPAVISARRK